MLQQGSSGSDVGQLQQALVEAGGAIAQVELDAAQFGPSTDAAVRSFQTNHGLAADGIVGPATQKALGSGGTIYITPGIGWHYRQNDARAAVRAATDYAVSQVGRFEVPNGSNKIPGDPYGNGDQPWCAYFVSKCYRMIDGGSPFGTLASAYKIHEWAAAHGRVLGPDDPAEPGDIFVILRASGHGHVGIVIGQALGGDMFCVEGNAGNAVRGTKRSRVGVTCLVRPVAL